MQFHLLDISFSKSLARQLARKKFDTCVLVLEAVKETYWQAGFMAEFFKLMLSKVWKETQDAEPERVTQAVPSPGVVISNPTEFSRSINNTPNTMITQVPESYSPILNPGFISQMEAFDYSLTAATFPWGSSQEIDSFPWLFQGL
jgi:hypothetical protein